MDKINSTSELPKAKCDGKTGKSESAWKRTKRILTCNCLKGNESEDSDHYSVPNTLCSGDKNTEMGPATVEHRKEGDHCSISEDNLSEVALDRIDPEEIAVMDKLSPSANVCKTEATRAAEGEGKAVIEKIESPIPKTLCKELMQNQEFAQTNEINYFDKKDDVQDSLKEIAEAVLVDLTDEPCNIPKVEESECALLEEAVAGDGTESTIDGEDGRDSLAQKDVAASDRKDISQEDEQTSASPEDPVAETDLASNTAKVEVPAKSLAIPRRNILGTGEAHVLPVAGDTDAVTGGVAPSTGVDGGEGPVQEFLQEVISERELNAMRVEVINGLLTRECNTKEVVDASILAVLAEDMGVGGSDFYAGFPSLEAFVETVDTSFGVGDEDDEPVRAPAREDLAGLDMLARVQAYEDSVSRALFADSDTFGAVRGGGPRLRPASAFPVEGVVFTSDTRERPLLDADNEVLGMEDVIAASQSDAILEAPTHRSRKYDEFFDLDVTSLNLQEAIDQMTEDEEDMTMARAADRRENIMTEDKEAEEEEAEPPTPFEFDVDAAGPTSTFRRGGGHPRASQEFIQEVAQEIIDPMLARVVRALEHANYPLAPMPSATWLTDAVVDATTASSTTDLDEASLGALKSTTTDIDLDTLVTSKEETESTFGGLEAASLGCLQPTTTVSDVDTLDPSMEATESMLKGRELLSTTTSPVCVVSTSSVQGIDKLLTSISESLATLETGLVHPPSTDQGLETSLTSLATASTSSLIELTTKPSLVDLLPKTSVLGLVSPSDESIADVSASPSTEQAGVQSMAGGSSSAEWPDQGKEQHRAARINNKRNKKRNRRGKK